MYEYKFTVLNRLNVEHGVVFTVFTDNTEGFAAFVEKHKDAMEPGSIVDVADLKAKFRLRHDGEWELLESYGGDAAEVVAAIEEETLQLLDELLGEEEST